MFKKSLYLVPVLAAALFSTSCKNLGKDEFSKTPSGLEYKLYTQTDDGEYEPKDAPAKLDSSKLGKVIYLQMEIRNGNDSIIGSTIENAMPHLEKLSTTPNQFGTEEGLLMLEKGDSAVFRIPSDSLFKGNQMQRPPFIAPGSYLTFYVKALDFKTEEETNADYPKLLENRMKELEERAAKQGPEDDKKIQEYIKENNLDAKKTESGVYYVITQPGQGPNAKDGDVVSVKYKGTLLNGKEFDSSDRNGGAPIEFPLGQGQVIKGWEEGIKQFNKGSKGILLIPSPQGYGPMARGADLPANSVLRFDIELVDIKDGAAAEPAQ